MNKNIRIITSLDGRAVEEDSTDSPLPSSGASYMLVTLRSGFHQHGYVLGVGQ